MAIRAEDPSYAFSFAIDDDRAAYLIQQLIDFNQPHASQLWQRPPQPSAPLHIYALDTSDALIGGVIGRTNAIPEWLEITVLWVATDQRGHGLGRQLLRLAETEAKRRGCRYARVNTSQFQAPGFYSKLGYSLYGQLENCPQGETVYHFHKALT
jgi:ribosomal protein S18 acetylase RimI-like enzyme